MKELICWDIVQLDPARKERNLTRPISHRVVSLYVNGELAEEHDYGNSRECGLTPKQCLQDFAAAIGIYDEYQKQLESLKDDASRVFLDIAEPRMVWRPRRVHMSAAMRYSHING